MSLHEAPAECIHKAYSICSFWLEMTALCTRQHCSHCISTKCRKMWLSNTVADHLLTPFLLFFPPQLAAMSAGFFYVAFRIISSCSQKNSHLVCNSLPVICTCLDSNYEVVRASACGLQMHITPYIKAWRNTFKLRLYFLAFHIFILSFFFLLMLLQQLICSRRAVFSASANASNLGEP